VQGLSILWAETITYILLSLYAIYYSYPVMTLRSLLQILVLLQPSLDIFSIPLEPCSLGANSIDALRQ
jgi:hypothetical protein